MVGSENFICYQRLGDYKEWFNQWKRPDEQGVLFVIGFPGRKALVNWLETVPNRFLYFGDFDLTGVLNNKLLFNKL